MSATKSLKFVYVPLIKFIRCSVQLVRSCYIIMFVTKVIEPVLLYGHFTEVLKGNSISLILSALKLTQTCICVLKCFRTTKHKYCQTCKDFKCFSIDLTQETDDCLGDMIHDSWSLKRNGGYPIHGRHLMVRVYKGFCFSNTNGNTFKMLMKSNLRDFHENPVQNNTSGIAIQTVLHLQKIVDN